jgi:hypothetical protein
MANVKVTRRKYRYSRNARQMPDSIPADANKRQASRFYRLKTGHCLTCQCHEWINSRPTAKCWGYLQFFPTPSLWPRQKRMRE